MAAGVDFIALSFVQRAADLQQAREALREPRARRIFRSSPSSNGRKPWRSLDDILRASDAVMVARGDLGLELPLERVPRVQKQATSEARALGIPVIVATQVLESMRTEPRPTRAEVSDAANAVDDRVDAIMLAGETAIGAHPVRAVRDARSNHSRRGVEPAGRRLAAPGGHAHPAALTGAPSARRRSRWRSMRPLRRSSPSRAAARPRGCCRRFSPTCRSWR